MMTIIMIPVNPVSLHLIAMSTTFCYFLEQNIQKKIEIELKKIIKFFDKQIEVIG